MAHTTCLRLSVQLKVAWYVWHAALETKAIRKNGVVMIQNQIPKMTSSPSKLVKKYNEGSQEKVAMLEQDMATGETKEKKPHKSALADLKARHRGLATLTFDCSPRLPFWPAPHLLHPPAAPCCCTVCTGTGCTRRTHCNCHTTQYFLLHAFVAVV